MISQSVVFSAIQKELGSFFSNEAHTESDIFRYINSATRYIAKYRNWSFLKKEMTINYTTPLLAQEIPYVVQAFGVNGDKTIDIIGKEDWFYPDNRMNAVMVEENEFIALSAGTYTLLYSGSPDKVSAQTTSINLPEDFEQVVVDLAINYGYSDLKMYDKANAKVGSANAELNLLAQSSSNPKPRSRSRLGSKHRI